MSKKDEPRLSREEVRAQVADQDRRWREQGHAEEGGARAGWGLNPK